MEAKKGNDDIEDESGEDFSGNRQRRKNAFLPIYVGDTFGKRVTTTDSQGRHSTFFLSFGHQQPLLHFLRREGKQITRIVSHKEESYSFLLHAAQTREIYRLLSNYCFTSISSCSGGRTSSPSSCVEEKVWLPGAA